jgi:hypothetical protein
MPHTIYKPISVSDVSPAPRNIEKAASTQSQGKGNVEFEPVEITPSFIERMDFISH